MQPEKTSEKFVKLEPFADQQAQKIQDNTEQSPRQYQKQQINQIFKVEGENRAIVLNDGENDRVLIGYQKDAF